MEMCVTGTKTSQDGYLVIVTYCGRLSPEGDDFMNSWCGDKPVVLINFYD